MAKKKSSHIDFPFYRYLNLFISQERKRIYKEFKGITKKYLIFNNPEENVEAYLRKPQFEALEMYVFLKEFCENKHLNEIFIEWVYKKNEFEDRETTGLSSKGQIDLFENEFNFDENKDLYQAVFNQIEEFKQEYPNYIFSLTMGLGKTVLMATSIFYEFLLANKFPKDPKFCHNALVFAPDKTVLQSLKEIQTFDKSKVVPPEYVNFIENIKFHFLDDTGLTLNLLEGSRFNIIISNTQKIILRRQQKEQTQTQQLFSDRTHAFLKMGEDLYGEELNEHNLLTNQRFESLRRISQLGIYVDEAHHVFGSTLKKDFDPNKATSLRNTINKLAESLNYAGTHIVGCYNYTGTPYVGKRLLPEVVYYYGLKDAIDNKYLKKVKVEEFENIRSQTQAFVRYSITKFWDAYDGKRFEGMLPKIAFFASSIDELQNELRPAVEQVLIELNIPISKILVNVGDATITNNDDLREFINLDTISSEKQFVLLVNKGKEGWNCRSLFGVGMHRCPKSKIFVLQATMRCLRKITEYQETAMVFLSKENVDILNAELEENFRLTIDDLKGENDDKELVEVRFVPPPVELKLKQVKKLYKLKERKLNEGIDFEFEKVDIERYRIILTEKSITDLSKKRYSKDITYIKEKFKYSTLLLIGEISRYLNIKPTHIKQILQESIQRLDEVLKWVNDYNELLYDWVIPKLFNYYWDIQEFTSTDEIKVELVKAPKEGFYQMKVKPELLASLEDNKYKPFKNKSFHLDNYCFDSVPEKTLFQTLLNENKVDKVWFTGMLANGQSDFVIHYIDNVSHTLRSYYPDFLVLLKDGSYVILEVKADYMIDDEVVKAKSEYAKQLADANKMRYEIIQSSNPTIKF